MIAKSDVFDLGIVVALKEEFDEILRGIDYVAREYEDIGAVFYFFDRKTTKGEQPYRCVATFVGEMGPTAAAVVSERLLETFSPITIANVGIGGAMSSDVSLGDVVVGDVIDEYISAAKASMDAPSTAFPLRLSGRPYTTSRNYLLKCEHIQFTRRDDYKAWQQRCRARATEAGESLPLTEDIASEEPRGMPSVHKGHIASGPIVSGTEWYKQMLLSLRDRKYVAVEMEAAGIMAAAADRKTSTLVIRGISDLADESKPADDKRGAEGAVRRYAMGNAVEFLWMLMDLHLLIHRTDGGPPPTGSRAPTSSEPASEQAEPLPKPQNTINFEYLPDAMEFHGWRVAIDTPETQHPETRAEVDPVLGTVLAIRGPLAACIDYRNSAALVEYTAIDIVFKPEVGQYAIYAHVSVLAEGDTRDVWLILGPADADPTPQGDGEWEWHYYTKPRRSEGGWTVIVVDLKEAVAQTFGKKGWSFTGLLGFRIRGSTHLARIGLYRTAKDAA